MTKPVSTTVVLQKLSVNKYENVFPDVVKCKFTVTESKASTDVSATARRENACKDLSLKNFSFHWLIYQYTVLT